MLPVIPGLDLHEALVLTGGDMDRLERLLREFPRQYAGLDEKVVELVAAGDMRELFMIGHSLKTAASYLGARSLAEAASTLENYARRGEVEELKAAMPVFLDTFQTVMDRLRSHQTQAAPPPKAIPISGDLDELIGRLAVLVATGNFAAEKLIDQLAAAVSGSPLVVKVEELRAAFDDLELEKAASVIEAIRGELAGVTGCEDAEPHLTSGGA